jgi:hypothetical protein
MNVNLRAVLQGQGHRFHKGFKKHAVAMVVYSFGIRSAAPGLARAAVCPSYLFILRRFSANCQVVMFSSWHEYNSS